MRDLILGAYLARRKAVRQVIQLETDLGLIILLTSLAG